MSIHNQFLKEKEMEIVEQLGYDMWQEVKKMAWREVKSSGSFWNPKMKGEELIGMLKTKSEGKFGPQFVVAKEDGVEVTTPSHKALQSRLDALQMPCKIRVTYLGQDLPTVKGQQGTQLYKVEVDDMTETI